MYGKDRVNDSFKMNSLFSSNVKIQAESWKFRYGNKSKWDLELLRLAANINKATLPNLLLNIYHVLSESRVTLKEFFKIYVSSEKGKSFNRRLYLMWFVLFKVIGQNSRGTWVMKFLSKILVGSLIKLFG